MNVLAIFLCLFLSTPVFSEDLPASSVSTPVEVLQTNPAPEVSCDENANKAEPLCSDLANFTCAPGDYDDGTGVSRGADAREEILQRVKNSSKSRLQERFRNALGSPESTYLKELAKAATGLSVSPDCRGNANERCNDLLAQGLTQISMKRLFPDQNANPYMMAMPMMGPPALQDLDYLINNPAYLNLEKTEAAAIKEELTDPDFNEKMRTKIFPDVQKLFASVISDRITDPEIRRKMLLKVNSIKFEGNDCSEMAGFPGANTSSVNALLIPNAFYDSQRNIFKYCNGFLITDRSEFKIVSVISHELAHSIDPCNIAHGPSTLAINYTASDRAGKERQYPFRGMISCLRSPESVGAKVSENSFSGGMGYPMPFPGPAPMPGGGLAGGTTGGGSDCPDCQGGPMTPKGPVAGPQLEAFCTNDQIGESFSDWAAAEVLPRYLKAKHPDLTRDQFRYGYSNVFRGMCSNVTPPPAGGFGMDPHPETKDRVNRIILASPLVREQMGCSNDPVPAPRYCGGAH